MSLTLDQIASEIAAKPELKTSLISSLKDEVIAGMQAEGRIIRTKEEEETFLTNYEKNTIPAKVQAEIGAKVKAVHDQYDNDLFELTGEKKAPNEKTYDFMKRKLAEMKAQKNGGDKDPVLADQIKELQAKLKERESYVAPDEVNKLKQKFFTEQIGFRLSASLDQANIAVPAHITDEKQKKEFIETQKRFIKNDFLTRFTAKQDESGNIVFYDGEKLLTDAKTAAPLTESDLVKANYTGYFVPEKKPSGGAGSGGDGKTKDVDVNEASLKTKAEVMTYLTKKGMVSGGADFNKEYMRIIKDYAITDPGAE